MKMASYNNEELLRGILRNNSLILRYIYKAYFHKIYSFVINNKGDSEEANDIFQEAIIVIYRINYINLQADSFCHFVHKNQNIENTFGQLTQHFEI